MRVVPCLRVAFNNERAGVVVEFVRMRGECSRRVLTKGECQTVKQMMSAIPDVTVSAGVECRIELMRIAISNEAVYAVGAHQQIALLSQSIKVADLAVKVNFNAQVERSLLEN